MEMKMFMKGSAFDIDNILNTEKEKTGYFTDRTSGIFGEMTEDEKNKLNAVITQKLKLGKRLSPKELTRCGVLCGFPHPSHPAML